MRLPFYPLLSDLHGCDGATKSAARNGGPGLSQRYNCSCRKRSASRDVDGCRLRISIETWRFLSASYAVVGVNTLLQLRREGICISVMNPPLYEGGWRHVDGIYPQEVERLLKRIPLAKDGPCPDIVLRMYFPFDFEPFPCVATKTVVFGTTEFAISSDRALKTAMEWRDVDPSIVFMTPSGWSAEGFERSGLSSSQIWVVPHGIDPHIFTPPSSGARQAARAARGWDESTLVFLNVGMLSHNKGIKELLSAYNDVWKWHRSQCDGETSSAAPVCSASEIQRLKLVLKGPSHIPPHLDNREVSHDRKQWYYQGKPLLDANIDTDAIEVIMDSTLTSEELASPMAAADIYVSPYKAEGFNLPVLESMAVGTPAIVTAGGPVDDFTTSEFVKYVKSTRKPGSMASIADLGQELLGFELQVDEGDLVEQMKATVLDSQWRRTAGTRATAHAHSFYTWGKVADAMLERFLMYT